MNFGHKLLLTAAALLAPAFTYAAPITSNPSLAVNGLSFNNFTCSIAKEGFAQPGSCSKINVDTITTPGSGIEFTSGFTAYPLSFSDAVLHYDVSSVDPISAIGLGFNGTFFGLAISSVTESIYHGNKLVAQATVACSTFGCDRTENIALDGLYNNLHVIKDINVSGALGIAQISHVDQTFTTTPEPSSTALLGGGLTAIAYFLRRRRAAKQEGAAA